MSIDGSARVLLREWEREWLELEDAIENDPASPQKQNLEPGSEDRASAVAELNARTKARMLRQLEIIQKLASLVPERPEDDLRPLDVFDGMRYLSSEAEKLHGLITNEPSDSISHLLNRVSLKVFWLWIPRWAKEGETRFSAIIKGIEAVQNDGRNV